MSADFILILTNYLEQLENTYNEALRTGELTPELSYRPLLDQLFEKITNSINPDIKRIFEPKKQFHAGRPDWRFYDAISLGIYGYIEAKGLDLDDTINPNLYKEQLDTYLSLGYRVILTDGLDFVFLDPDYTTPKKISLIIKNVSGGGWLLSPDAPLLENELRNYFKDILARSVSEEQLIVECATRARVLSRNIGELANAPLGSGMDTIENQTIQYLKELKTLVEDHHDPLLNSNEVFSGFVAQVLIFGLIFAHRVSSNPGDTPKDRYEKIKKFWIDIINKDYTDHLKPFKALVNTLHGELSNLGPLGTWYDDCCLLLSYVKLSIEQEYDPDYHKLFETFLSVFDPKTRFDFGAFFTPRELAELMVVLCEDVARKELGGLSLYDKKNKLIDPCCGTGSFLESLLISSLKSKEEPSIIGFEILPGPYSLSHYRISMVTDNYPKNVQIVLTNTLSDDLELDRKEEVPLNLISEEQTLARQLAKPPLTLIIGNPPSSDSLNHSIGEGFQIIQKLLEDFRPPEEYRTSRQNIQKQLQNEFIKFLRWSVNKLNDTEIGILAFILPSAFLENGSYIQARKWIYENFTKFWIMDIDLDARTGVRSSSLFNTLQGRSLLVALKETKGKNTDNKEMYYKNISELNKQKKYEIIEEIKNSPSPIGNFNHFEVDKINCILRPKIPFDNVTYEKFWSLYSEDGDNNYIFERHCSGVKLAPSSLFVHALEPMLLRRSEQIANNSITVSDIVQNWYSGQDKVPKSSKFTTNVRLKFASALSEVNHSIIKYSFRPFLTVPALVNEEILKSLATAPGGGTRYRPEVISAFASSTTKGIAIAPSTKDLSNKLHRFASFCWNLPDNDLCKRGNAHIFCNQFPLYKNNNATWNSQPVNNINENLIDHLLVSQDDILFYVYAILCSDKYLDEFEGILFNFSGNHWPKIPITRDPSLFKRVASLGKELAQLEEIPTEDLSLKEPYSSFTNLFTDEFRLRSFKIDDQEEVVTLKDNNHEIKLYPISKEILEFKISGYQVIQQWLKIYSFRYTRTSFTKQQFLELLLLFQRINDQMIITQRIDELIGELLKGNDLLI